MQSKPRGTLSRPTVQSDVQRIVEVYQRSGRYDVRVDPKIIELPNGRVDLIFEITEGAKTGVEKIIFVGNKSYSTYRLHDIIKTGQTNRLSFLKTNDIYDADRVEADRDLLRRFYLKNGYADVRIVSAVGEFDPAQKGFIITFTIDEGEHYISARSTSNRASATVPAELLRGTAAGRRRHLQRRRDREVGRGHHHRRRKRGYPFAPCVRAATATSRAALSISFSWSMKARTPTSSASICAATRAPATT